MMKKNIVFISLFVSLFAISNRTFAQLDSALNRCQSHLQMPFISDGQSYTALLNGEESAEFYATFYEGSTYRLVGYSGNTKGQLIFSLYDQDHNLLFTNEDFQNTPYWDFEFNNTMDCIVEAKLDPKHLSSGFAVMLIGFKQ